MKNFVVVVISLLILSVFVALNYTLWDRESLLNQKETHQASINALGEKLTRLEQTNQDLSDTINALNNEIKSLTQEKADLENIISQQNEQISEKNRTLLLYKNQIDLEPFNHLVKTWIKSINEKDYAASYILLSKENSIFGKNIALKDYTRLFEGKVDKISNSDGDMDGTQEPPIEGKSLTEEIKTSVLKTITDIDLTGEEEAAEEDGTNNNEELEPVLHLVSGNDEEITEEIEIIVDVDIDLAEGQEHEYFKEGRNSFLFQFEYNQSEKQWMIKEISNYKPEVSLKINQ